MFESPPVRLRHARLLRAVHRLTRALLWAERRGWPVGRALYWIARRAYGWYVLEVWTGRRWRRDE